MAAVHRLEDAWQDLPLLTGWHVHDPDGSINVTVELNPGQQFEDHARRLRLILSDFADHLTLTTGSETVIGW